MDLLAPLDKAPNSAQDWSIIPPPAVHAILFLANHIPIIETWHWQNIEAGLDRGRDYQIRLHLRLFVANITC
jgi:hypothetical protein